MNFGVGVFGGIPLAFCLAGVIASTLVPAILGPAKTAAVFLPWAWAGTGVLLYLPWVAWHLDRNRDASPSPPEPPKASAQAGPVRSATRLPTSAQKNEQVE